MRVGAAIAAFRRGDPVIVIGGGGREAAIALAVETAATDTLALAARWAAEPLALAITDRRASALHIPPTGEDVIRLALPERADSNWLVAVADPTRDLEDPLRGPFVRHRTPVSEATRAAVDLAKHALLLPAALSAPLAAPAAGAERFAEARGLRTVPADCVFRYHALAAATLVKRIVTAKVPLEGAEKSRIVAFRPGGGGPDHLAIVVGEPHPDSPVLARLHSECLTGDLLGSLKCDCGSQLRGAIAAIAAEGSGVLLYLAQEGRGIGIVNKLRAYRLQQDGFDTYDANERLGFADDERLYLAAARMLKALGFRSVRLMTNNPAKVDALEHAGVAVVERVPHSFPSNNHNESYLATKKKRSGHYL